MSSLEALLRPVTSMINRQIEAKSPARELCAGLADRVMAIRVRNTAIAIYLLVDQDQVSLSTEYEQDPDVVVSGSLLDLTRLAGPAGAAVIRDGDIELSGDAHLAEDFQKLLRYGRPDLEEELSGVIGDVAAHGIGEIFRGVGEWGREARATMRQNVGEYLQEESRTVPTRDEVDAFRGQVDTLRDDVARFETRLKTIEAESNSKGMA
jgi:ubiquinone biosynthesis protein UbiJ